MTFTLEFHAEMDSEEPTLKFAALSGTCERAITEAQKFLAWCTPSRMQQCWITRDGSVWAQVWIDEDNETFHERYLWDSEE